MNFGESIKKNLTASYADFSGRADRSEFWFFMLFSSILGLLASVIDGVIFGTSRHKPLLYFVANLAFLLPFAGLGWRRIADVGLPGWLSLFPTVTAALYILVLAGLLMEGHPLEEDVEMGLSLIFLVIVAPFIILWCLPTKKS
jgi:uncharacterized membrane protein YhaH (DUF805 family)